MNFSPDNQATLTNLLAALGEGLDPSTGYSMLQQTLADQQQRQADRTAQMQQYAGTIADQASQGVPYGAARGLMDLMTPRNGIPNRVDNMLSSVYPTSGQGDPWAGFDMPTHPGDAPYDPTAAFAQGPDGQPVRIANNGSYAQAVPRGDQAVSPLYTDNPAIQMQAALQQAQLAAATAPQAPTQSAQDQAGLAKIGQAITNALHPPDGSPPMEPGQIISQLAADPQYGGLFIQNQSKILATFPELIPQPG